MARKRATAYTALLWHVGVFVVINAFFWILDLSTGAEGLQWAYWITIFWGLALVFTSSPIWLVTAAQRNANTENPSPSSSPRTLSNPSNSVISNRPYPAIWAV
jgi:hypothetical protein